METPSSRIDRRDAAVLAGAALLLLAFVAATWARWPLVTADAARELYVPFHVRHGAVIYRDFLYLYGPVAPYWLAGLLAAFGEHLAVLYVAAAVQVAAIMGLLYVAARQVLGPWPSAAVLFLFFTHFALGRDIAGYMWPYAFAATYGVLFGLATLVALMRHAATGRLGWLALAGVAVGLSAVTKLEYGAAAAGLAGGYLALRLAAGLRPGAAGGRWREALALGGPAIAVAGAIAAAVLARVDLGTVLESAWPTRLMALWSSKGQWHGDLRSWADNLRWLALAGGALALAAGHRCVARGLARSWVWRVGAIAAVALLAVYAGGDPARADYLRTHFHRAWVGPSFLVLLGVLAWHGREAWREARAGRPVPAETAAWLLIGAYGLLVAMRTMFKGLNDYTPYQAPVAMIAWVALAARWLPARLAPEDARPMARALAAALMLFVGARHLGEAAGTYSRPTVDVVGPAGLVRADAELGAPFAAAAAWLRAALRPGETFVAAPMEPSLYLFVGRDNPVREDNMFFGYLITPAEQADFIERLRRANVRYFALSTFGYAGKRFGEDYMRELAAWLRTDCRVAATFGGAPYGITIYETPFGAAEAAPRPAMRVGMPAKPAP
jgi:hypothetical protein